MFEVIYLFFIENFDTSKAYFGISELIATTLDLRSSALDLTKFYSSLILLDLLMVGFGGYFFT
jgi:hypothetical protein